MGRTKEQQLEIVRTAVTDVIQNSAMRLDKIHINDKYICIFCIIDSSATIACVECFAKTIERLLQEKVSEFDDSLVGVAYYISAQGVILFSGSVRPGSSDAYDKNNYRSRLKFGYNNEMPLKYGILTEVLNVIRANFPIYEYEIFQNELIVAVHLDHDVIIYDYMDKRKKINDRLANILNKCGQTFSVFITAYCGAVFRDNVFGYSSDAQSSLVRPP